jgi:hypothetical protein
MSTKNLARTVIEGGRNGYSRWARRHSHAVERAQTHWMEQRLCRDFDPEIAVFRPRDAVAKSFDDKLGPARRWLRSQVGRPWDKVRSDLFARFDTRTTAGRHIVFDHLLKEVRWLPVESYRFQEFWISPQGILRARQLARKQWTAARHRLRLPEPESVLQRWLDGRRVIERGARLYWLVPTLHGGFRQHHELDSADAQRFRALPGWFRERFEGPPPPDEGSS